MYITYYELNFFYNFVTVQQFFFFKKLFIYYLFIIFIFGCVGSSFLCEGSLQLRQVGATLHRGVRASVAASLVAEQRLQTLRLSSCGPRAQPLRGMWDLPRPGLEPVLPALAGRFSTTAPPGKPQGEELLQVLYVRYQYPGRIHILKKHVGLGLTETHFSLSCTLRRPAANERCSPRMNSR